MEKKIFSANTSRYRNATHRCTALLLLLFFLAGSSPLWAQSKKVTGTVKDSKGNGIQGVNVAVKNEKTATATDVNGFFTITVPGPDAVLVFTSVGYEKKEMTAGALANLDISLSETAADLDQVVVIGYGSTVKKRDVTGAISSVTEKQIRERQPVTLFDALQGQASGVLVTNDNGDPMGQGTIQIRGASTINSGTGPLYVIDGVISDNGNFVNPADVESFEILKDASSAAIYGARGANGVILITTKKGKEGKPTISTNYYYLMGRLAHKIRTTSADELRFYRANRDNNNGTNVDSLNPYLNADNDYQDLLLRDSRKHVGSVSISGGNKGINYYGGVTYTDDQSIVLNSYLKRVQSKINLSYQASPKLRISHNLSFAWQTGNIVPLFNTLRQVFDRNPWTSIYRPDGSYAGYIESKRNPVAQALFNTNIDNDYTALFNTQVNYQFTKELSFTALFSAQLDNETNRQLQPSFTTNGDAVGSNSIGKRVYWEAQTYFNYKKIIAKDHTITGLLAFSADRKREDQLLIASQGYVTEEILTPNAGNINIVSTLNSFNANTNYAYSDASFFGRLGYSYAGRYILQGTWRRDGSSRFGINNKWGNFFSGSAAWRFSDEKFMDWSRGVLSDGKLRFSLGKTGNDRVGYYPSYSVMNFGQQNYNNVSSAAESTVLGNSGIKWETTVSTNYGLDLSFLNGRISFTAEYYNKKTDDLLYTSELPKETGKTQVAVNIGSIINKGWEFTLAGNVVNTKNFGWDVSGNVSFTKGYVDQLANHTSFISGNKWLIREGGKIGDFYLWKNLGVYQYNASNAYDQNGTKLTATEVSADGNSAVYTLDGKPYTGTVFRKRRNGIVLQGGDTEWLDLNNDGTIDEADKIIAGNGVPDYFFGFSSNFRYKNFTLSLLVNGQVGNEIYNTTRNAQNQNTSTYSPPIWDAVLYSWQKQGDVSIYPLFSRKDDRGSISSGYNSLYLEDGSFIRLSSVRLTYGLDQKVVKKAKLKSASVYVYGSNLLTWTDYSWFDPEFTSNGLNIGEDVGRYPKRREVGVGVNVNF